MPSLHSHLALILLALLSLGCSILCEHEDYEPIQIVDDYNEPFSGYLKPSNNRDDDDEESEETPSGNGEANGESASENGDDEGENDAEETPATDEEERRPVRRRKAKRTRRPRPSMASGQPEEPSVTDSPPPSPTEEPPPKGPDFRSLLVKVYRGPTKQVNEKPFAAWGYFVKYPSDSSAPASVHV